MKIEIGNWNYMLYYLRSECKLIISVKYKNNKIEAKMAEREAGWARHETKYGRHLRRRREAARAVSREQTQASAAAVPSCF